MISNNHTRRIEEPEIIGLEMITQSRGKDNHVSRELELTRDTL